jgi:hypothetical protein
MSAANDRDMQGLTPYIIAALRSHLRFQSRSLTVLSPALAEVGGNRRDTAHAGAR